LVAAAFGPRASVFAGGSAGSVAFYVPGGGAPAFGFAPLGATTTFSTFDTAGSAADGFSGGFGSQRLSWSIASAQLTAGGRCGDRVGLSATSNYQLLVFTK